MKNRLLFPIIFAFIFSACSDFTGNEDAVEASLKPGPDTTAPILKEVTAVTTPTTDTTPNYTFSSSEAGTITYGGSCSSSNKNAISGNNTITLRTLSNGTYSDCTITVKNTLGNSATLIISTFVVDSPTTRTWYDLKGITFGDNTFVAVGNTGAIRTSSDNGSSWDNGTSGTTYYFNEVTYGDSTFIAVGQSGKIITSSDNGSSWDNSTQDVTTAQVTGVAFGDDVGIAVASTDILRSRNDNGSNWVQSNSMDDVYDVVFGNRTASGEVATCGTITHGGDHDNDNHTSVALSGGSGSGAQATVNVSGGNVTSVSITKGGTGLYQIGDVLTIDNATIGGNDNGKVATCGTITHGGEVATVDNITQGGNHNNGEHDLVALSGGSGSGAQATVNVSGDNVTSVTITHGGTGLYQIGDVLTIDNATIVGGDDNATVIVATVSGDHNNGPHLSVALSGGSGSGAQATVNVSGGNVTSVSITEGGTGLYQIGDVLTIDNAKTGGDDNATCRVATVTAINATCKVATVTVTSKVFVGVGNDGKVCYSTNYKDNTETWSCPQEIVDDKQLYGIAYGNNKFIAVGESGTVIISDNGTNWTEDLSGNSNTSANLYSIAFGNDRFVAVGQYAVIVSTDNGTSFTPTETNYIFNDISFGNGVFVAVGSGEIIYTSTDGGLSDGDTWTKVHGR
jgi:photosystem II stability/assembly factor-like uncharacterized protein